MSACFAELFAKREFLREFTHNSKAFHIYAIFEGFLIGHKFDI